MSLFPDFIKARQRQDDSAPQTEAAAMQFVQLPIRTSAIRHNAELDDNVFNLLPPKSSEPAAPEPIPEPIPEPKPQGRNRHPVDMTDLSRLSIDHDGRLYWDGKPVETHHRLSMSRATDRRRQPRRGVRGDRRHRRGDPGRLGGARLGLPAGLVGQRLHPARGIAAESPRHPGVTRRNGDPSPPGEGSRAARHKQTDGVSAPRAHAHHEIVEAHLGDLSPEIGIAAERHQAVEHLLKHRICFRQLRVDVIGGLVASLHHILRERSQLRAASQ